jgi:hypothetical protein
MQLKCVYFDGIPTFGDRTFGDVTFGRENLGI